MQQEVNKMIEDSKNTFTKTVIKIPGNLESLLGIKVRARSDQKPQAILMQYDNGNIEVEKIKKLVDIVISCI